jgi:hypothetical protein
MDDVGIGAGLLVPGLGEVGGLGGQLAAIAGTFVPATGRKPLAPCRFPAPLPRGTPAPSSVPACCAPSPAVPSCAELSLGESLVTGALLGVLSAGVGVVGMADGVGVVGLGSGVWVGVGSADGAGVGAGVPDEQGIGAVVPLPDPGVADGCDRCLEELPGLAAGEVALWPLVSGAPPPVVPPGGPPRLLLDGAMVCRIWPSP